MLDKILSNSTLLAIPEPPKHKELKDNRRFLTDEEFDALKSKINNAYFKAADLVPSFNGETHIMTIEQADEIEDMLAIGFHCMPYCRKIALLRVNVQSSFGNI